MILVSILVCCCVVACIMVVEGKVYRNKIRECQGVTRGFCGLEVIPMTLPEPIRKCVMHAAPFGRRVDLGSFKAGVTVDTPTLARVCPQVIQWYHTYARDVVSRAIGEDVVPTPLDLPTSACVLVYNKPGDRIGWHFDTNYYRGRFFTVLIPITPDTTQTTFRYRDAYGEVRSLRLRRNTAVVFEGGRVFHEATPLGHGERRLVLSLQFTTDPSISTYHTILRRIKDVAYIGLG